MYTALGFGTVFTFITSTLINTNNSLWIFTITFASFCLLVYAYTKSDIEGILEKEKHKQFRDILQTKQLEILPNFIISLDSEKTSYQESIYSILIGDMRVMVDYH